MNRNIFSKKTPHYWYARKILLPLVAFIIMVSLFINSLNNIDVASYEQQRESLINALNKSIAHNYAITGYYPPSLEYILDKYQIVYNDNLFYVDYKPIGANIPPSLTVVSLR